MSNSEGKSDNTGVEEDEFKVILRFKSSQVKSALLSILPHVQHIHTEN